MVATGHETNNIEVLDLQSGFTMFCEDLPDFPVTVSDSVGVIVNSMPMICGGYVENGRGNVASVRPGRRGGGVFSGSLFTLCTYVFFTEQMLQL